MSKKAKPNTYIKKLGLEPVKERTPTVLRKRIRKLKKGLKTGEYKGKLAERAEFYLREHERALEQQAS